MPYIFTHSTYCDFFAVISCYNKYVTGIKEGRMVKSSSTRVITADTTHMHIEPSHIIEYEWPPKSGERYFIQVSSDFTTC